MSAGKNQPANAFSAVLLLSSCIIFSSQVNANLLNPTLLGKELQAFASDALGVDEMQVGSLPGTRESKYYVSF